MPQYEGAKAEYQNDDEFVKRIEKAVPRGSMIFQLPYFPFPLGAPRNRLREWESLKGYLHSSSLRWTYGSFHGRPEELWWERTETESTQQLVETLAFAGFGGIYIDRFGYYDSAADLESGLESVLEETPEVSRNERLSFFNLTGFAEKMKTHYTPTEWRVRREQALQANE